MNISQLVDAEIFRLMQVRKLLTSASMRTGGRKRGGKRALSAAGRARISAAQKKRWAQKRKNRS